MNRKISRWIDRVLKSDLPGGIAGFCFNLYEESDGTWAMELVGTGRFDSEDEDWACDVVTDFGSRDCLYSWKSDDGWEAALRYMVNELEQYLESGKRAELLKSKEGVGVGFVDGDIEILYQK